MSELAGKSDVSLETDINLEREYMDNRVTLRRAIDTQLGLIGLAQQTGRDDLLEVALERLNTLLNQIPGDILAE